MVALIFGTKSVLARCLRIYAYVVLINGILHVYIGVVNLEFVRASNTWMRAQLVFRGSRGFLVENTFLIGIYFLEDTSHTTQC